MNAYTTPRPAHAPIDPARRAWVAAALLLPFAGAWAAPAAKPLVEVWKDPNCGCCEGWVEHMRKAGFEVRVFDTGNAAARARFGMPDKFGSCHTASVGGYAIEGHVPAADVQRLLKEKPKAVGLAAPGMPVGSPGMDGPMYGNRKPDYDVLLVLADGTSRVFQGHR